MTVYISFSLGRTQTKVGNDMLIYFAFSRFSDLKYIWLMLEPARQQNRKPLRYSRKLCREGFSVLVGGVMDAGRDDVKMVRMAHSLALVD